MKASTLGIIVVVAAGAAALCLAWPRLHQVETGRTPEYPDLQPRSYAAGADRVGAAVKAAIGRLPRWRVVGAASGLKGTDIQAEHLMPLVGLKEDITVQVRRQGGRTELRVLSRSQSVPWDFGQNARNIRGLLEAVDNELATTR
ncbi:MAG TPA: DUF1499 domain-containing protein [Vicinamibacteria bacterium]|jgi:hypothetical protein